MGEVVQLHDVVCCTCKANHDTGYIMPITTKGKGGEYIEFKSQEQSIEKSMPGDTNATTHNSQCGIITRSSIYDTLDDAIAKSTKHNADINQEAVCQASKPTSDASTGGRFRVHVLWFVAMILVVVVVATTGTFIHSLMNRVDAMEQKSEELLSEIEQVKLMTGGQKSNVSSNTQELETRIQELESRIEEELIAEIELLKLITGGQISNVSSNTQELETRLQELESRIEALRYQPVTQEPVAFYARSSNVNNSYQQNGNAIPLVLDSVVFQTGGDNYNTTTGKFRVPVSGYYIFTYGVVLTKTGPYGLAIRFWTGNGHTFAETHPTVTDTSDDKTVTGTAIIRLYKGQELRLDTHNNAEIRIHGCWFAGWLQYKF